MDAPRQLGPYRLIKRLGHGGMAEVFLAVAFGASGFEKRVAIKTLLPELRGEGEFERILIEEARLGARLVHRNLVAVHDLGCADGTYYVRMDWVDGADLGTVLRDARPPLPIALYVAEEVALALDYVHRFADEAGRPLGLVHRDVTPSNVLLSRTGEVKLADFGIAKATLLADVTHGNVRKGKYAYMSPEQVLGAALGPASDVFNLGVTLAELVLGARPFDAPTPLETMDRIREARAPALPGLAPGPLAEVIRTCLRRDPRDRYATAGELRRALASVRALGEPAGAAELGEWIEPRISRADS